MSLRLGKEYFDVNQVIDSSGSAHRQAFGTSQNSQSQSPGTPTTTPGKAHGLTYLVAQHKRAEILQAEAAITGFLTLRPTDMQSETHRLVVRAVGQKHSKVARLRMAPDMDPEREKQELIRASAKKPRHPRGEDSGGGGTRRRRAQGGGRRRSGGDMDIWSDDDEPGYDAYANDDDDARSPKKRRAREPEERRGGEYQTDDFVVADSDDDDAAAAAAAGGHGSDGIARQKKGTRPEAEEDVLDKLDAQISQQEADRKRRRDEAPDAPEEGGDQVGETAMEIESEEDEEEFRVRRAGGARKRTTVAGFDEEDE